MEWGNSDWALSVLILHVDSFTPFHYVRDLTFVYAQKCVTDLQLPYHLSLARWNENWVEQTLQMILYEILPPMRHWVSHGISVSGLANTVSGVASLSVYFYRSFEYFAVEPCQCSRTMIPDHILIIRQWNSSGFPEYQYAATHCTEQIVYIQYNYSYHI